MPPVVEVCHVWKRFQLHRDRADSVGQLLVRMLPRGRRPKPELFWALQDVDFAILQGESLGIIGSNGSGKSTLLKILTRTMRPTLGEIAVRGRVSALIELGAGFHPDFTGRENVYLNASLLGIPRREVDRHLDDIIEFSGIRPFIDTPVKYYSSGMHARLGFSVAIHVRPQILIVDEVLAVGDEAFQQKCMERIRAMKAEGVSIILVSHSLGAVEELMDRVVWIEKGVMRMAGTPAEVVRAYRRFAAPPDPVPVRLLGCAVVPEEVRTGQSAELTCTWANEGDTPALGYPEVDLRAAGKVLAQVSGRTDEQALSVQPGEVKMARLRLALGKLPVGAYEVDVRLVDASGAVLGTWPGASRAYVVPELGSPPLALPHEWGVG